MLGSVAGGGGGRQKQSRFGRRLLAWDDKDVAGAAGTAGAANADEERRGGSGEAPSCGTLPTPPPFP